VNAGTPLSVTSNADGFIFLSVGWLVHFTNSRSGILNDLFQNASSPP
jgi:phage gp29-like protein